MSFTASLEKRMSDWFEYVDASIQSHTFVLLSLLLVSECVVFLNLPPATTYEPSLVDSLPLTYWILFYVVMIWGVVMLLVAAATGSTYWRHGIALILANYTIFLALPLARGYKLYGRGEADALRHLGDVKGIVGSGTLPGIWYPGEHVLMAELNLFGVPMSSLTYLINILFTAIHILGLGILVRALSGRRVSLAFGLAVATPLVYTTYHLEASPSFIAFMTIPVFLAVLERYRSSNDNAYLVLVVLLGMFVVYTHPMSTVYMTLMIAVGAMYSWFHNWVSDEQLSAHSLRLAAVFPTLLFLWIINFLQTKFAVINLLIMDKSSPGARNIQEATEVTFTPLQLLSKFLHLYGTVALYSIIAGIVALYIVVTIRHRDFDFRWGFSITQFAVGAVIVLLFLSADLVVKSPLRSARYAVLFAAVVVAFALQNRFDYRDLTLAVVIATVVIATAVIGANAAYQPNRHLTYTEYDGTQFIAEYSGDEPIYSARTSHKMQEYVLGTNHPKLYPSNIEVGFDIPRHLGYTDSQTTAMETFGNGYVVTKDHDIRRPKTSYYTEEQKELLFYYDRADLRRLHRDPTADKIYSNGGLTNWYVNAPP